MKKWGVVMGESYSQMEAAQSVMQELKRWIGTTLFGLERTVEDLLIATMAHGHILLEDVPGVGKTALAKSFSEFLGLTFHRIQCTPDLLPADIVGGLIFNPKNAEFILRKGPIFTNLLLVDEINRALPRTQSALLEAMAEGQVTIDGKAHPLPQPFLLIATQNPLESQGVFPLPEAQLDRFLLKTSLGYPSAEDDITILSSHMWHGNHSQGGSRVGGAEGARRQESPIAFEHALDDRSQFLSTLNAAMANVRISRELLTYISNVVRATRTHPDVAVGASPRAMIMLANAARAAAVLDGRSFVTPDDVQRVAAGVLFHRLVTLGPLESSEMDSNAWMNKLLQSVEVPIESGLI